MKNEYMISPDRAIEILNPKHREDYPNMDEIDEACRMGMEALQELRDRENADDIQAAQAEMAVYEAAVRRFGEHAQILIAVEEMAELTKALLKYIRYGGTREVLDSVAEERADVEIMLNQLHVIFGDNSEWECRKLDRLAAFLEPEKDDGKYRSGRPEWADDKTFCPVAHMSDEDFQAEYADKNPCADCPWGVKE